MKNGFRFYGAAVSLSRRRSLRRGTPGHDGIPRALGIMPLRHRYKPVGVTLGKKPGFFGIQAFLFISVSVGRPLRFYGAAAYSTGIKKGAQNLTFTPSLGIVLSVSVIGAVVARFVHTEEVTGSNPVSRTK